MVERVHYNTRSAESLTKDLDFFTVETLVEISDTGTPSDTPQVRFNRLVEIIGQRGQPVILSSISTRSAEAGEFLGTNETTGGEDVYYFKFAVEHSHLWTESGNTDSKAISLNEQFDGLLNDFVADGVNDNISVTFAEEL